MEALFNLYNSKIEKLNKKAHIKSCVFTNLIRQSCIVLKSFTIFARHMSHCTPWQIVSSICFTFILVCFLGSYDFLSPVNYRFGRRWKTRAGGSDLNVYLVGLYSRHNLVLELVSECCQTFSNAWLPRCIHVSCANIMISRWQRYSISFYMCVFWSECCQTFGNAMVLQYIVVFIFINQLILLLNF